MIKDMKESPEVARRIDDCRKRACKKRIDPFKNSRHKVVMLDEKMDPLIKS